MQLAGGHSEEAAHDKRNVHNDVLNAAAAAAAAAEDAVRLECSVALYLSSDYYRP